MEVGIGVKIQASSLSHQPLNEWSKDLLAKKTISSDRFSFIILSDSHVATLGYSPKTGHYELNSSGKLYQKILNNIADKIATAEIKPAFMIHGGDAVDVGTKDNFAAFVQVTNGILRNLPVFVSLGNHDFDYPGRPNQTNNFRKYIGKIREAFVIPNTSVKLVRLCNTLINESGEPEFKNEDLDLLPGYNNEKGYYYIIDFHVPLRLCHAPAQYNDHYLSESETRYFLKGVDGFHEHLLGVFAHHHHGDWCCNAGSYNFPFIVTACGGTKYGCNRPHYFYVTAVWNERRDAYDVYFRMYDEYGEKIECQSPSYSYD
jgi:hypothetical protein